MNTHNNGKTHYMEPDTTIIPISPYWLASYSAKADTSGTNRTDNAWSKGNLFDDEESEEEQSTNLWEKK